MNDTFRISTPGVDVEKAMEEIRRRVEEKRSQGVYRRYPLASLEPVETASLKSSREVYFYYLKSLIAAAEIDINDFEIECKRPVFGRPAVWLKKLIWKLLKFYTFRLFSQQKDFNARVALVLQGMENNHSRRLSELEARIKALDEKRS